jgi:uncharacterized protein YcfJ
MIFFKKVGIAGCLVGCLIGSNLAASWGSDVETVVAKKGYHFNIDNGYTNELDTYKYQIINHCIKINVKDFFMNEGSISEGIESKMICGNYVIYEVKGLNEND